MFSNPSESASGSCKKTNPKVCLKPGPAAEPPHKAAPRGLSVVTSDKLRNEHFYLGNEICRCRICLAAYRDRAWRERSTAAYQTAGATVDHYRAGDRAVGRLRDQCAVSGAASRIRSARTDPVASDALCWLRFHLSLSQLGCAR